MSKTRLAQLGLVLLVLARAIGLLPLSFQAYLYIFVFVNLTILVYGKYLGEIAWQPLFNQFGLLALIIAVAIFMPQNFEGSWMVISGIIAFSVFTLTQNAWGLDWPAELARDVVAFARATLSRTETEAGEEEPETNANAEESAPASKQEEKVDVQTAAPVKTEPVAEKVAETPAPKQAADEASKPEADTRTSNLATHNGKPFGFVKQIRAIEGMTEEKVNDFKANLNLAQRGDIEALERVLKLIDVLGITQKTEFEKFLTAPAQR